MKPLVVILLLAITVQAQTLAEIARKERERQSRVRSVRIITFEGRIVEPKAEDVKADAPTPSRDLPEPKPQPAPDSLKIWNDQLDQIRTRIQTLQDQETALRLKQNDLTNQVYAVVTDPATQERAQAQLALNLQQMAAVRTEIDENRKTLDAMILQGPPKK